jgi:YesN/AraC family two-component response regulator
MKKILIVDDEPSIRSMLRQIMEGSGFEVFEAANGVDAEVLVMEKLPDLIITDIFMPDKDGLETIISIKKMAPHIKIVAISGSRLFGDSQQYLSCATKLGVDFTFSKPINNSELLKCVNDLLQ